MIQRGGGTGFPPEAIQGLRILRNVVRKEFQSDEAPEVDVLGFVNNTHPAAAQLLDDVVVRDGLANHWAEILGLRLGQVNEGVEVGRFCGSLTRTELCSQIKPVGGWSATRKLERRLFRILCANCGPDFWDAPIRRRSTLTNGP